MLNKKELIGKNAEVKYNGKIFKGRIVDETKNMLHVETEHKIVKIIKKNAEININGKRIIGKNITQRPQDRIKKC